MFKEMPPFKYIHSSETIFLSDRNPPLIKALYVRLENAWFFKSLSPDKARTAGGDIDVMFNNFIIGEIL